VRSTLVVARCECSGGQLRTASAFWALSDQDGGTPGPVDTDLATLTMAGCGATSRCRDPTMQIPLFRRLTLIQMVMGWILGEYAFCGGDPKNAGDGPWQTASGTDAGSDSSL